MEEAVSDSGTPSTSRFITDGAITAIMILTTDGTILITEAHITGVTIRSTTAGTHRSLSI